MQMGINAVRSIPSPIMLLPRFAVVVVHPFLDVLVGGTNIGNDAPSSASFLCSCSATFPTAGAHPPEVLSLLRLAGRVDERNDRGRTFAHAGGGYAGWGSSMHPLHSQGVQLQKQRQVKSKPYGSPTAADRSNLVAYHLKLNLKTCRTCMYMDTSTGIS